MEKEYWNDEIEIKLPTITELKNIIIEIPIDRLTNEDTPDRSISPDIFIYNDTNSTTKPRVHQFRRDNEPFRRSYKYSTGNFTTAQLPRSSTDQPMINESNEVLKDSQSETARIDQYSNTRDNTITLYVE